MGVSRYTRLACRRRREAVCDPILLSSDDEDEVMIVSDNEEDVLEVIILSEDDEVPIEPAVEAPGEPEEDDPEEDPEEEYMPEEDVPVPEEYVPEEAYVPGAEMLEVDNDPEPEEGSLWSELTDLGGDYADYAEPPQGIYERGEASRGHELPNLCSLCSYYEATHRDLC